jgi:hypothetical protein
MVKLTIGPTREQLARYSYFPSDGIEEGMDELSGFLSPCTSLTVFKRRLSAGAGEFPRVR